MLRPQYDSDFVFMMYRFNILGCPRGLSSTGQHYFFCDKSALVSEQAGMTDGSNNLFLQYSSLGTVHF